MIIVECKYKNKFNQIDIYFDDNDNIFLFVIFL